MKRTKKVFAFVIAMVCVIATVMNPLISSASVSQVNVDIYAAGGTFDYSDSQYSGFGEGMGIMLEVGKSLSDDKFTITDPTFFNPNRKFEGWVLKVWKTVTDDYGNQWEDWVQLDGTSLMTTQEILAYQVTGDYDSIRFEATYEGDDNDYFSEVQLDLFGGVMKITEYRYYWDDVKQEEVKESEEREESFWSTRLKEDGTTIEKQTDLFDLSATPTKDGATFEGWIQAKYYDVENADGGIERKYERVSDTVYSTAQMLAMKVPHDDTVFAAKWSDMEVKEYYWNGPMRNISIQGEGGAFSCEISNGWDETETEGVGFTAKATLPLSKSMKSLTDPTFFHPDRKFLGWKICELQEVDTDYWDWIQIPGTKELYTTQELMSYVIPEGQTDLGFIAQWDGDVDNYYSMVSLDLYGGEMEITRYEYEWDNEKQENIQVPITETISHWLFYLREDDNAKIGDQTNERYDLSATPTKKGADFQGWLQFKSIGEGDKDYELVSDKPYTTAEILNMKVPHDDTVFAAKWSDVKVEDYFAPQADNYFDTNNGDMLTTYVDDDGKTVTESINGNLGMTQIAKTTLKEYFEYANASIHSMKKQCATFEGWTVTEYEKSEYISWPAGKEFNIGDPDIKFVYIGTYYDNDEGIMMERWLGMINYKEYSNKMSTDEIMKLDGTKNHYFVANWKEAHTGVIVGDKDATCTKDGYTGDKVCSECNCTLETGSSIAATGHKPGTKIIENAVAATCTKAGSHDEVVYCTVCDEEITRETITDKALGHKAGSKVTENAVAATCTKDGSHDEVVYCTVCDEEITRETITDKALGHKAGSKVTENAVAATCTKDGSHDEVVYCTTCNEEITRETITDKAIGHAYKDSVCTNCGDQLVLGGIVEDVDTSKPSENVKPVVKKDAIESVTKEIKKVVDAIVSGNVTDEMKDTVSSELIDAIKTEVEAGNKISTEIVATIVTEDKVEAGTVEEIKKNLGENGKLAQYLDLTVMVKSVSTDGTEKELGTLKELDKEITFTIVIPENLVQDGRVFFVLRNHEGKVDKLGLIKNTDGSFSFKTDRFSTYALAYEDVKITTSDTTTSDTNSNVPKTGDNSNIILYGAVAVMAVAVLVVSKKRSFVK